ncbi:MAG: hypothetical protein E7397_06610 [Ruminococcaceae bacterium]|nr:hypothetical protein [Oscillospiraceae bacterium]
MKHTKKLIATLLALILLSLSTNGFAYYTGITEESEYAQSFMTAETTLYGLGVLPAMNSGSYDSTVTRADFAGYVSALGGGRNVVVPQPAEQDISFGEAVKMIVDMTDNTIRAEYYGTYPAGYLNIAGVMGITRGLGAMQEYDKINYGMAVQMLYNTMRVTPGTVGAISEDGLEYEFDNERTVLSEYLEIQLLTGFVTADGFWSLNPEELPGEDSIIIDGKEYTLKNPELDDYVGFEVDYYYSTNDDMILAVEKSEKAQKVVLNSADVAEFRNNTYLYDGEKRVKRYQLDKNAYIVSNYEANMSLNINMYPENSDIVLVDADGNDKYETVLIKTYTEIAVQVLDTEEERLVSKAGDFYLVPEDEPIRIWSDGKLVDAPNVKSGSHATIVVNAENEVREIYLSNKKLMGTVSSHRTEDGRSYVTIDGVEYPVARGMINKNNLDYNISGEFSLNFKGEIANLVIGVTGSGASTRTELGYLIRVFEDDTKPDTSTARILIADGSIASYDLSEKCRINDNRVTGSYVDAFSDGDGTRKQVIYYTINADNLITKIYTAVQESSVNFGDHKLHVSYDGNIAYYTSNFDGKVLVGEDTLVFSVPTYDSNFAKDYLVGIRNISGQTTHNITAYNFELNDAFADVIVVYRSTAAGRDGFCGGPGPKPNMQYDPMHIVLSVTNEYNEHYNASLDVVEYMNLANGATGKKILADNGSWQGGSGGHEVVSYDEGYGSLDLQPGDLFHFTENILGEIGTVHKSYDASDRTLVKGRCENNGAVSSFDYTNDTNSFYSGHHFWQGYPVASDENYVALSNIPISFSNATRDNLDFYLKHASKTRAYVVDVNGNKTEVTACGLEALLPATDADTKAVIYSAWAMLYNVVVFEY